MQSERDLLTREVMPELAAFAKKYNESVNMIDLRWGIDTTSLESDESAHKVLSVCLDEIDRAKPYMIVLVGDRYGWVPEKKQLLENALKQKRREDIVDLAEKSVTALEIEYGALSQKDNLKRCLFYFREPLEGAPDFFGEKNPKYQSKLEKLKTKIKQEAKKGGAIVRSYSAKWNADEGKVTELDGFVEQVKADLQEILSEQWKAKLNVASSWQELEEQAAWHFVDDRANFFCAREEICKDYEKVLLESRVFALKGSVGCGKSTVISQLARTLKKQGYNVLPFISGQSALSASAFDIVKQAVHFLERALGIETHFGEGETLELKDWKTRWLQLLAKYNKKGLPKHVLIVDAIDQLIADEMRNDFSWLPESENIKIVFSCLDSIKIPASLNITERTLTELDKEQKKCVIKKILEINCREISEQISKEIVDIKETQNPLYLSALLQRLVMMESDDFKKIAEIGNDMEAINKHLLALVKKSPKGEGALPAICHAIISEASSRINKKQCDLILALIAVSRHGLRESDLMKIVEKENGIYVSVDFSRLVKYMRPYFNEGRNGQWNFTHRVIREGILATLTKEQINKYSKILLKHLKNIKDNDDYLKKTELIWLASVCGDVNAVNDYLFETKNKELFTYMNEVLQVNQPFIVSVLTQAIKDKRELSIVFDFLRHTKVLDSINITKQIVGWFEKGDEIELRFKGEFYEYLAGALSKFVSKDKETGETFIKALTIWEKRLEEKLDDEELDKLAKFFFSLGCYVGNLTYQQEVFYALIASIGRQFRKLRAPLEELGVDIKSFLEMSFFKEDGKVFDPLEHREYSYSILEHEYCWLYSLAIQKYIARDDEGKFKTQKIILYPQLAGIYLHCQGGDVLAEHYYKESLALEIENNSSGGNVLNALIHQGLCTINLQRNNLAEAKEHSDKAVATIERMDEKHLTTRAHWYMLNAEVYAQNLKDYPTAIKQYLKAKNIYIKLEEKDEDSFESYADRFAECCRFLGWCYIETREPHKAIENFVKEKNICTKVINSPLADVNMKNTFAKSFIRVNDIIITMLSTEEPESINDICELLEESMKQCMLLTDNDEPGVNEFWMNLIDKFDDVSKSAHKGGVKEAMLRLGKGLVELHQKAFKYSINLAKTHPEKFFPKSLRDSPMEEDLVDAVKNYYTLLFIMANRLLFYTKHDAVMTTQIIHEALETYLKLIETTDGFIGKVFEKETRMILARTKNA